MFFHVVVNVLPFAGYADGSCTFLAHAPAHIFHAASDMMKTTQIWTYALHAHYKVWGAGWHAILKVVLPSKGQCSAH